MLTPLVNQWGMLHARSSLRRCGPYGYIGTSQTMAYLSSCGYPPVLSSLAAAVSKNQNRTSFPSSDTFSFPHPHCAFFLSSSAFSHRAGLAFFSRTKEMVAVAVKEERQLDGHGLEIVLHVFAYNTVCTSFSLCPHFRLSLSHHPSLPFDTFTFFKFLLCSWFPFSLLLLQPPLPPNSVFRSFDFLRHIPPPLSLSLILALSFWCFFFLVCVRLFPLDYVVRAPAVDYQSVDSQRAAKASSTNMRQYPNDWLVGSGPWKQASVSAWARLGPQVCPKTILAGNTDTLQCFCLSQQLLWV